MTHVFAVFALHANSVEEELATIRAENDGVKLLLNKFVTILLVDFFFPLAHSSLSAKTASSIEWSLANIAFDFWK